MRDENQQKIDLRTQDTTNQSIKTIHTDDAIAKPVPKPKLLEIPQDTPAYLKTQKKQIAGIKPITKKAELSIQDSIFFNLKQPANQTSDYFFHNSLSRFSKKIKDQKLLFQDTPTAAKLSASGTDTITMTDGVSTDSLENVILKSQDTLITESVPFNKTSKKPLSPLSADKDMLSGLLIFSFIIIGFVRLSAFKYVKELFNAAFFAQSAGKLFSVVNVRNIKPAFTLNFLYIFNTSIFIFEILSYYEKNLFNQEGIILLGSVFILILGLGFVKNIAYRTSGYIFDVSGKVNEYLFNANNLSKVFAITSLPIIAIIPFVNIWIVPSLIKAGAFLFIILYLIQLFRGAKIILHQSLSIFYMFLYFCALEILPLSILFKVLIH
ncbi:DUF4271 domain-containing protein [Marinilabiliaceae bacterium JC017]|nr:DUF4271 domain-containing protein [Marinilabiliaceae bacterium JC017]